VETGHESFCTASDEMQGGSVAAERQIYDQEVAGSTSGLVAVTWLLVRWTTDCLQVNYLGI